MRKVVLVSGASSGLGLATAAHLYGMGHTVYAGARSHRQETTERNAAGGALHKVWLDVTDDAGAAALVGRIVEAEGRIDVLVNCAAVIVLGSAEDITFEEFHHVMATNLYGTMRMCRCVLPHMRARGAGLIVNFSSGAGVIGIPFSSAYCSSKFAVEGFSEVLRWECKGFGIDVVLVEPGDCRSGSQNYRLHAGNSDEESIYAEDFATVTQKIASDEANGCDPAKVAAKVARIIAAKRRKIRYNVFRAMEKLLLLKMILPTWLTEMLFFGYYKLKKRVTRRSES